MAHLDLTCDPVELTAALVDIPSVSRAEAELADAVHRALSGLAHLQVHRDGNAVVARTRLHRAERVILAGHLDTVPLSDPPNLPGHRDGDDLVGRGTVDMKGGVAVQLALAAAVQQPSRDVTYVFYDCEEIADEHNGLRRLATTHPDWLAGDFAVLLEPTDGAIEGGCKGTMRFTVTTYGKRAHSGRPWQGHNAIHDAADVLTRLADYRPQTVTVDGLDYIEGLNAVRIGGGVAGNVIPDRCTVTINYRFAPHRSTDEALAHVREVFDGYELEVQDLAPGARPGLDRPVAQGFLAALDLPARAKQGWTDVARFAQLGIPAVNFGPGDPGLAHTDGERCPVAQIGAAYAALRRWLESAS